jgi:glycosyltransferase involved in cell wall biosynthesis
MIKVAFFGSAFAGRFASGTAQTTRKLIDYLIQNESSRIEVWLILKNDEDAKSISNDLILAKAKLLVLPQVKGNFLRSSRQFYLATIKFRKQRLFDIVHYGVPRVYPFYWKFPSRFHVCTFHAAGDITVKQEKFVLSKHIYNLIIKWQWRHFDKIYSDSNFATNEIALNYGIPVSRIDELLLGSDQLWNVEAQPSPLIKPEKFNVVIVGRWQDYKNVHSPLTAFRNSSNPILLSANLILVGKSNQMGKSKVSKIVSTMSLHSLQLAEYVSDQELKFLYENAQLVIHPSINEGFGLPAFEAFSLGAKLMVHHGTPADYYLSRFPGVYVGNLLNISEIEALVLQSVIDPDVELTGRRDYLGGAQMTWDQAAANYVRTYFELIGAR